MERGSRGRLDPVRMVSDPRVLPFTQTGPLRRPLDGGRQHQQQQQYQHQQQWQRRMGSVQAAALAERPASLEESAKEIEAETVALKPSSREEQARVRAAY